MIRFCLALASVSFWPGLPPQLSMLSIPLLIFLCYINRPLRSLLPIIFGLVWGIGYGYWLQIHQLSEEWQGVDLVATGTVVGFPEQRDGNCRFDLALAQLTDLRTSERSATTPRRLRLTWYRCERLPAPGQRWQLPVRLKRPQGFVNPGGFDYPLYLISQGVDASGYIRANHTVSPPQRLEDASILGRVDRLRMNTLERLQQQKISNQGKALLGALLLGDKRGLDPIIWKTLRDTGTAHLFVISGLHIGMLASLCFGTVYALGRLRPQIPYRYRITTAALSAVVISGCYALLSGWGIPSQRAWVMVCAVMLSLIGFRAMTPSQRLWLAATAVLLIEPLALRQPGFWLSFAACAVLIYAFSGHLGRVRVIRQLLWAQIAVLVGLTPWLLYLFQQWPPLSPLINLVAIPVVSLFLPLALLATVLLSIWPGAGDPMMQGLAQLLDWGWQGLGWTEQLVSPLLTTAPTPLWAVILALMGSLLLLLPRAVVGRWVGLLFWLPLFLPQLNTPEKGAFHVTLLDVGQGLSVLVETENHRLLYDAGPKYRSGFNAAEAAIIPYLSRQGIRDLDLLLISHADIDHSGGQSILESELRLGETLSSSDRVLADAHCRAGQHWMWDQVEFRILHPDRIVGVSENNRSCVLQIDNGRYRVLLTGDIEAETERGLIDRHSKSLQSNTLVAAHHGSRSSTSDIFLEKVNPQHVLISSGWLNRFGHPHPEIIERVVDRGMDLLNTASMGAIKLRVSPSGESQFSIAVDDLWGYWHRLKPPQKVYHRTID